MTLYKALMTALLAVFCMSASVQAAPAVTPAEARAIAKQTYTYGYPLGGCPRIEILEF